MNGLKYFAAWIARHAGMWGSKFFVWGMGAYALAIWLGQDDTQANANLQAATEINLVAAQVLPVIGHVLRLDIVGGGNQMDGLLTVSATIHTPHASVLLMLGLARLLLLAVMILGLCFAGLVALIAALTVVQWAFRRSHGARFASGMEVAALHNPKGSGFGFYSGMPLVLHTDKHVLIMASTRSGKGVAIIIPHLLRYAGSAFVLDPKGENARATGRQRARLNGKVHCLDPFGISGKPQSRFNPLSRFTPDNMEAESKALAAALFASVERDHWSASGQQLLAAFIMYVHASDKFSPKEKDLNTVRSLLLGSAPETLLDMKKSTIADGLVSGLAASFLNTPDNERGSIISSAQRETEILDNPDIARCLAAAGDGPAVNFTDWHSGTMTVFLCLSAPKFPTFNRWLRLVLTSALDEMTDRLNPPPLPVCFMLDELATLGHLEAVENAVGLAAGYGVQLFTVFQDVAQMKDLYKNRWASFIGNAGIRALFSLDDYDTARYWSDFIGGRTVVSRSESQNAFGITQSRSSNETFRAVLNPDEIMLRYSAGRMLVLPQGSRPIEAERVPYFRDRSLRGLWDDPRGPLPAAP
jgi:type IV secretion system protein VirD4